MAEQRLDRRSFLAGAAGVATAGAQVPDASGRPNILHIMTDQQQWATIAGRSGCRTPNIDRLAREGLLFDRSYTPSAVCCPARAMLLSGAYHWHNGVYNQVHSPPSVHRGHERRRRCSTRSACARRAIAWAMSVSGMRVTCARRLISVSTRWRGLTAAIPRCFKNWI